MMTRTTIRIERSLLDELKRRALEHGRSLTREIEEAIRAGLVRPPKTRRPVVVPTFKGGSGPAPGVDLRDTSRLLELSESDASARR